jgi:hypothetical protein
MELPSRTSENQTNLETPSTVGSVPSPTTGSADLAQSIAEFCENGWLLGKGRKNFYSYYFAEPKLAVSLEPALLKRTFEDVEDVFLKFFPITFWEKLEVFLTTIY